MNIQKLLFSILFYTIFSLSNFVTAQIYNPVKWSFGAEDLKNGEFELSFKANIEKGWHVYSQFIGNDGPVPTSFSFENSPSFKTIGIVKEGKAIEENDVNFNMTLKFFEGSASFKQKIKIQNSKPFSIKGSLEYMCCDNSKCLPPETVPFEIKIEPSTLTNKTENEAKTIENTPVKAIDTLNNTLKEDKIKKKKSTIITDELIENKLSVWGIFIAGFLGGLLALLTPCVFPMIPLTVSFFTKQSKTRSKGIRNAFLYSLSIVVIYVLLGMLITISLGPDALNSMASNVWVNLAFFIIFVVFAVSFLGAFEITLPNSWANKADSASEKGGILGIFFMAFTLSLVSFSCTGPIIGSLLVQAAVGGNVLNPIIGMLGFSMALALPFGLFATFPGWLNSLPKSGGWLNSVKVVLGFLELALALKFLSNVDLAYHWGFLKREIFIALWIVIFGLLGLYLLGKIKLSHDSDLKFISIPRILMAILTFSFVIYLIPGMWGAPLKLISGFPPPAFYNEGWSSKGSEKTTSNTIEGTDSEHCPHNLNCFHDYSAAIQYAKSIKKPLMVDFTGWSCVNCRKMEDQVWIDERVLQRLNNDYVLVSLYVDDKTELPENEKYTSKSTGKKINTTGNKYSDLQTSRFNTNSQPYYVLLDQNEELLVSPQGYDPSIEKFVDFLDNGKKEFEKRQN